MNTTENITWTSKKVWGAVGLTHHTDITIGEDTWSFTVDQPAKGQWIARGWRNGDLAFYRDAARTLAAAKDVVLARIGELKNDWNRQLVQAAGDDARIAIELAEDAALADAENAECWCEWVDIGVGEQRVSEVAGCPQHCPYEDVPLADWIASDAATGVMPSFEAMAPRMLKAMEPVIEQMRQMTLTFRKAFHRPPCGCPTPTHRMSCGVGAAPKVVQS